MINIVCTCFSEIKETAQFAIETEAVCQMRTTYGKTLYILPYAMQADKLLYYLNDERKGTIWLRNIVSLQFRRAADKRDYAAWYTRCRLSQYFAIANGEEKLKQFVAYYRQILQWLCEAEASTPDHEAFQDFRNGVMETIFASLLHYPHKENLLVQYILSGTAHLEDHALSDDTILLLSQSNLSQKQCIYHALQSRISIIEGPPGTGKTTTILSVIANMVWRRQKVLVVSKNNSAIDNIAEEIEQLALPNFFIRMGNYAIMNQDSAGLIRKLRQYKRDLSAIRSHSSHEAEDDEDVLQNQYDELALLEKKLNALVKMENELAEWKNQLRHLEKRTIPYDRIPDSIVRRCHPNSLAAAQKRWNFLKGLSECLGRGESVSLWRRIQFVFHFGKGFSLFQQYGVYMLMMLEEHYVRLQIKKTEAVLQAEDMDRLKQQIRDMYEDTYIPASTRLFEQALLRHAPTSLFAQIQEQDDMPDAGLMMQEKMRLKQLYPVILTTADSVLSNFYSEIKNLAQGTEPPFDVIIVDEASQCDVLSGLPLLFLAKRLVVVGDSKQLTAITPAAPDCLDVTIDAGRDFFSQNLLTTIAQTLHPAWQMLLEHYRCDFNIINYCNKFFYDGQLIIYRKANQQAMQLIDNEKGKYVEQANGSFFNTREIRTVQGREGASLRNAFVITPFKEQAARLRQTYQTQQDRSRCGTIHAFQGRGADRVYFSAVLNDTAASRQHLLGPHNLFAKELINVAVSRAKKEFILVSDTQFFEQYCPDMANLIHYIETYGRVISDDTVCVFDYLYQRMADFVPDKVVDNPFEEELKRWLESYAETTSYVKVIMKVLLAELVTDRAYLQAHPDIKEFVEHHAHVDFLLYDSRIWKPMLAIELDGQMHKKDIQKQRDAKKDMALQHMQIPLLRISSKAAWDKDTLWRNIQEAMK